MRMFSLDENYSKKLNRRKGEEWDSGKLVLMREYSVEELN